MVPLRSTISVLFTFARHHENFCGKIINLKERRDHKGIGFVHFWSVDGSGFAAGSGFVFPVFFVVEWSQREPKRDIFAFITYWLPTWFKTWPIQASSASLRISRTTRAWRWAVRISLRPLCS